MVNLSTLYATKVWQIQQWMGQICKIILYNKNVIGGRTYHWLHCLLFHFIIVYNKIINRFHVAVTDHTRRQNVVRRAVTYCLITIFWLHLWSVAEQRNHIRNRHLPHFSPPHTDTFALTSFRIQGSAFGNTIVHDLFLF